MTAVITGVGVVSAFGLTRADFDAGLRAGAAAVGPIRWFDASTFPVTVAGEVPLPTAPPSEGTRDRKAVFATMAAAEAWAQAGCGPAEQRAPLVIALGLEQAFLEDFAPMIEPDRIAWARAATAAGDRALAFRAPVDTAARAVRRALGLRGPTVVNVSACAAGALAVAHAAQLIARGRADVIVCGGSDSMVNPLGIGGMARLGAPSPRNAPDACRPFDRDRDGLVIGEGAAMFVVERADRARARGARALAAIVGWGATQDAYRATAPRPDGSAAAAAIARAIARAGIAPADVGYVNAHGTGTPLNDPAEARALATVFGPALARTPVSSIKGAIGHLMAAAGAIELAACVAALTDGSLPGTAHHQTLDPECPLDVIGPTPRRVQVEHAVSNSFGFGGHNASLVLRRCP
ncbi:MAG: beta-ketoacyl-[acyl-carrier-protein] synthase family protein [Myxococcales bacterium]|nr:beta-ketoacyl-[acyl-carrier-protein] synthase family protein [Myxococcales bacterium]